MAKRMLIDATHSEETRVVVVNGNKLDELDFEIASKKQLKGNIYLAKGTRVEPSLQAAFVEYGGNRHGFLAFSEIHPDYYRIPVADREALLAELDREEGEAAREADAEIESGRPEKRRRWAGEAPLETAAPEASTAPAEPGLTAEADEPAAESTDAAPQFASGDSARRDYPAHYDVLPLAS